MKPNIYLALPTVCFITFLFKSGKNLYFTLPKSKIYTCLCSFATQRFVIDLDLHFNFNLKERCFNIV